MVKKHKGNDYACHICHNTLYESNFIIQERKKGQKTEEQHFLGMSTKSMSSVFP